MALNAAESPVKKLSVREDQQGSRALHSNIESGRKCFVTIDEMAIAKKFKLAINRTFNENGGVFWQAVNDEQISSYVMDVLHDFSANNGRKLMGTLTIGRQPNIRKVNQLGEFVNDDSSDWCEEKDNFDSSVYVLNENVQVNQHGVIEEVNWRHMWMVPYLRVMPLALNDKSMKTYLRAHKVNVDLPFRTFDWHSFISRAKEFFNVNFMPFILFLSGGVGAFHYEKILASIGSCPVPTAVGDTASGKSTALKLIGSLMGMRMVSQSSGEFIVSDLTKTTIPLCWDDPTFPSLLRQPLVSVFNGLGNQTQVRGNERPLTSFLLTINFKMDDDMRSFERTTPIWFNKLVNNENEVASDFLEARKQIFSIASTHSIVDIISMGKEVNDGNLADHISFFKANLSGLPSRLAEIYSVYRLLSHEFIKLVDDDLVLTTTSFDEYLTDEFLPYVKSFYDVSVKAHTTLEEVFRLLVQAIAKLHLTKCEVGKWMRPNVRNKTSGQVRSIVFVIPTAVAVIGKAKLPEQPTEKNVRDLVSKIDGANGEYKSTFLDQPKKISCVKVPRYSLSNDILGQIDKLFDEQPTEQQTAADNVEEESCQECKTKARELTEIKSNHNNEKEELKVKYERQLEDLSRKWTHQLKEEEKKNAALKQEINSLKHQLEHAKVEVRSMKSKQNQQSSCSQSSSVAQAIAGIVETQNSLTINASSLDDSGIGEELEVTKEDNMKATKRNVEDKHANRSICNLCYKKKSSASMIQCKHCEQWLHCSCLGIKYKDAQKMKKSFRCRACEDSGASTKAK